jgi:hypothetical protein
MRSAASLRWVAITAAVLGVAGSATAQSGGNAPSPPEVPQVGFERRAQLSPSEELAQADLILTRLDQSSATVRRQLERARTARDVVKSLCLNDKLSQIDVAGRTAKDRQAALQAAVQRNDVELANHEFTIMTVLRQRAEQLVAEANQCLGEEVAFIGQTQVSMEVNNEIIGIEPEPFPVGPSLLPPNFPTGPFPPPTPASPLK